MRAQIEQVDKNIEACLEAAGAKPSDIVLTRAYVTVPDAFDKNANVLADDFGPKSSGSSVPQCRN
jgi:enamine deaminase RidA (YjgF/YER057c/UK114 family)